MEPTTVSYAFYNVSKELQEVLKYADVPGTTVTLVKTIADVAAKSVEDLTNANIKALACSLTAGGVVYLTTKIIIEYVNEYFPNLKATKVAKSICHAVIPLTQALVFPSLLPCIRNKNASNSMSNMDISSEMSKTLIRTGLLASAVYSLYKSSQTFSLDEFTSTGEFFADTPDPATAQPSHQQEMTLDAARAKQAVVARPVSEKPQRRDGDFFHDLRNLITTTTTCTSLSALAAVSAILVQEWPVNEKFGCVAGAGTLALSSQLLIDDNDAVTEYGKTTYRLMKISSFVIAGIVAMK